MTALPSTSIPSRDIQRGPRFSGAVEARRLQRWVDAYRKEDSCFGPPESRQLLFAIGLLALGLAACSKHDLPQYPPNYREYAYITNGGSGTVTVLDVVNVRIDRELPVGRNPVAVIASPTRNEVYVVNSGPAGGEGSVSVINAENNTVAATIPVHRQPVSIDLAPDGSVAYVANSGSNTISVLNLKTRREIGQISTGGEPDSVRIAPDNKSLVVANQQGNSVSI